MAILKIELDEKEIKDIILKHYQEKYPSMKRVSLSVTQTYDFRDIATGHSVSVTVSE